MEHRQSIFDLVKRAGNTLLSFWPGSPGSPELIIETKPDGSKVTQADFASNEILVPGLKELFPNDAIVSEEGPGFTQEAVNSRRAWILDPLDGTSSFISGRDDFSILVALTIDHQVVFSVMYFPAKGIFAFADEDGEALINDLSPEVSKSNKFRDKSVYFRNFKPAPGSHLFPDWMDSGMAFLSLAKGDLDGVILRMTSHKEWDISAPELILRKAGGLMTDELGNKIEFNKGDIKFRYLVASNGVLHQDLMKLIPKE